MKPTRLLTGLMALLCSAQILSQTSQAYNWKNVQIVGGGFIPGIIYNEKESGLVYVRTDIGGAYRLDQATQKWTPLTDWIGWDDWGLTGIVSLATDPVDPNRLYLAAGTYTNSWESTMGAILRSTDRGNSFQITRLPFKLGGNMPGRGMGERLVIDPNNNAVLYLGAPSGNGLWKSIDYGATWSKVNSFPNPGTYVQDATDVNGYLNDIQGVVWITFDKRTGSAGSTTQTIYVGVADTITSVYKSTDGGSTWSALAGQPKGYMPHKGKLDPVSGYLYLAYSNRGGPYDGDKGQVWRYNTGTGAWTEISPIPASSGDNYYGYSGLTIDRQNPNTIMVTAYSSWWPDTHIWRSKDNGTTWTRIWDWTRYPNRSFRYTQDISVAPWLYWGGAQTGGRPGAEVYPKLGWMTESFEIDPFNSNKMMYGTGATLYGSDNLTQWDLGNQIKITVKAAGIEETAIQEIVSPTAGPQLLSGMYDIYGFTHTNVDVVPNAFYENPRIATVSIDYSQNNPSYIFRVGHGSAADGIKAAGYSTNGGTSWTPVGAQPTGVDKGEGTCAVNTAGTIVVWAPNDAPVSYTTNNGKTWKSCAGVPQGAIVKSDRVNANKFYAFKNGTFYVSTNGGVTFTIAATGLPANSNFKTATGFEGHIWLTTGSAGLWRSTNSGATFTQLANVTEADCVGFGKAATGQTYPAVYISAKIAGVRGIYRSDDEAATWIRINDDQHQYAWTGKVITGDPRIYGRVYFATNGRGIIYGDIKTSSPITRKNLTKPTQQINTEFSVSPNPSNGQEIVLNYSGQKSSITRLRITDASGRLIYIRNMKATDFTGNRFRLRLAPQLSKGVYFISVEDNGAATTTRFIVE